MRPESGSSDNGHAEDERRVAAWVKERRTARADDDYVSWREADLSVRQSRRGLRVVRLLAWATAVTGFVVLLMDVQRDPNRCHPSCFDDSDHTFEAGHVWTAYGDAWQWEAQLVLGWLAFLASLLYVAGRRSRRRTIVALGVSLALVAAWIVWLTVQPSPALRG